MFKGSNRPKNMRMRGEDLQKALEQENFILDQIPEDQQHIDQQEMPPQQLIIDPIQALEQFQNAKSLNEKVEAGKLIQGFLAGEGLNEDMREKLTRGSQELQVKQYMDLYKYSMDLRKVSEVAFLSAGGRTPQVERMEQEDQQRIVREKQVELQQLKDDQSLDPKALETAQQFATFLPAVDKFTKRQKNPQTHTIQEDTFQNLKDGSRIGKPKGATKVGVYDSKGNLMMRPSQSDDPRKIDMVAKQIQEFLTPGRTEEQNRNLGLRIMSDLENGSTLIQQNTNEFISRAQQLDPEGMHHIIESGSQQLNEPRRIKDQENVVKPKKGLGLFSKKKKTKSSKEINDL